MSTNYGAKMVCTDVLGYDFVGQELIRGEGEIKSISYETRTFKREC